MIRSAACVLTIGALVVATGCNKGAPRDATGRCIDWVDDIESGTVELDGAAYSAAQRYANYRPASGDFNLVDGIYWDDTEFLCDDLATIGLLASDGSLTPLAIEIANSCSHEDLDPRDEWLTATERAEMRNGVDDLVPGPSPTDAVRPDITGLGKVQRMFHADLVRKYGVKRAERIERGQRANEVRRQNACMLMGRALNPRGALHESLHPALPVASH